MNSSDKSIGEQMLDIGDIKRNVCLNLEAAEDLSSLACVNQSNNRFFKSLATSNTNIDKFIFKNYADARIKALELKENLKNIANYKVSIYRGNREYHNNILFIIKDYEGFRYLDELFKILGVAKEVFLYGASHYCEELYLESQPWCKVEVHSHARTMHDKSLVQRAQCIFLVGELQDNNKDEYVKFIPEFFKKFKKDYWSIALKEKPVQVVLQGKLDENECNAMIKSAKEVYTSEHGEFHCHIDQRPAAKISEIIFNSLKANVESLDITLTRYNFRIKEEFEEILCQLYEYATKDPVWTLNTIEKFYQWILPASCYSDQGFFGWSYIKEKQVITLQKTFMDVLGKSLNNAECNGDVLVGIAKIVNASKLMDRGNYFGDNEAQKMLNSKLEERLSLGKK